MYASKAAQKDLVPLDLYYKKYSNDDDVSDDPTPGDHYATATVEGKAEAEANGYSKLSTLGWVWPNGYTSRYGLPVYNDHLNDPRCSFLQ